MCVIATAAKKRHMKRAEVLEAIKHNSAGFFGFTVHDGQRRMIRTLDDKQFMEFFDSVDDDDVWAMHARIPSRGEKSLDNVHGWEEDGIVFAHNMTLSVLDDMMKRAKWTNTDSEFFFRKVFIPYFRGLGEDAYKDGALHPDLDNLVRHFCGSYNKLLFIMPDNRMLRYGDWVEERDRKEGDEVAFFASNVSYKVYEPKWPARKTITGFNTRDDDDRDDWSEYYGYGGWHDTWSPDRDKVKGRDDGTGDTSKSVDPGKAAEDLVWRELGPSRLCQLALLDLVGNGAVSYRSLRGVWSPDGENDEVDEILRDLLPDIFDEDTYTAAVGGLQSLAFVSQISAEEAAGTDLKRYGPEDFAREYAVAVAGNIVRTGYAAHNRAKVVPAIVPTFLKTEYAAAAVERFERQWRVFCRVAGVAVDFAGAKGPASFACVADSPVRVDGKWKTAKVRADDVVVDEDMFPDEAFKAIAVVLGYIQSCAEGKEAAI